MANVKLSQITPLGGNPATTDYAVMTTSGNTVDSLVTTAEVLATMNGIAGTWTATQIFNNGKLSLAGSGSGNTLLEASATAAGTITFPAVTDTVAVLGTAQSWTAKQTYNNSDIALLGSSTGATTFASANAGASNYTVTYQAATGTVALLNVADQTLSGGANVTSSNQGTKSSGTYTVDCGVCPLQYIVNGGAFTLAAPASDGSMMLLITNNASAGAISFSGFTVGSNTGDALTTTNTNKFTISIWEINGVAGYRIAAHQ